MSQNTRPFEIVTRVATPDDIPTLVHHRRWMFEDMNRLNGKVISPDRLAAMEQAYQEYLELHMGDGSLTAWVAANGEEICASGALSIIADNPPHFINLAGTIPYLHSVYTCPEHRRRGYAQRIIEHAIDFCKAHGYFSLNLHASQEGRQLYEQLGFQAGSEMRLRLVNFDGRSS
jgi:GNAT superfamily N-acetyltransferase